MATPRRHRVERSRPRSAHTYFALILLVESMVLVSFTALDVLLFYIFFEAMLIPMYFLIGGFRWPVQRPRYRSRAAVKFLLYNLLGGLVMLAAVVGLYVVTARGGAGSDRSAPSTSGRSPRPQRHGELGVAPVVLNALFLGFMFAFAVKAPLWPLHSWLPDAAVRVHPGGRGADDGGGRQGRHLRACCGTACNCFRKRRAYFAPVIVTLAVIGIVYGAMLAIGQTDVMRLIAYTSISHFGFIILGIFAMTSQGAGRVDAVHGQPRHLDRSAVPDRGIPGLAQRVPAIAAYGGVQKVAPVLAGTFLVAGLATLRCPVWHRSSASSSS